MLSIEIVKSVLLANKDKFFTVEFVKLDGTTRRINGRLGVRGYDALTLDDKAILMYDLQLKGFRRVTFERVKAINMKHGSLKLA